MITVLTRDVTTPVRIPGDASLTTVSRVRGRGDRRVEYITIQASWRAPGEFGHDRWHRVNFGRWEPANPNSREDWRAANAEANVACSRARLDLLARRHTAFSTFDELIAAPYTPTLRNCDRLADVYDIAAEAAGTGRKASRF